MTAASEALADRKLIREIAARAGLDERTVRNALDGWRPRGSSRRETFEAARSLGVDVATVPARTDAENAAWLAEQRAPRARRPKQPEPCPECERLRARVAELEAELATSPGHGLPAPAPTEIPSVPARRMQASSPPKRLHIIGTDGVEVAG